MSPLIVYSPLPWNAVFERPRQVLSRLCGRRSVVFVEQPRGDCDAARLDVERRPEGVTVLRPRLPGARHGFHEDNAQAVLALLREFFGTVGLSDSLAWLYTPMALPVALGMPRRGIVYDRLGDLDTFREAPAGAGEAENRLLAAADVVLTDRADVQEALRPKHPNVHCVPIDGAWDATVAAIEALLAPLERGGGRQPLELWGGLECTVNRVGDVYFSQMETNGHATRLDDVERFALLGIRAIRYPVLWERIAPDGLADADWSWSDERLLALRKQGVTPIAGLVHHGSGPRHTSLVDPRFPEQLAEFAGAVARRYPWLRDYTPVNEPLTTARFSGLYGVWFPHARDDASFLRALYNQCRGVVLAMRAIRAVNPQARLVQTDDLGKTHGTPAMAPVVEFYNNRRWLSWDLLCGRVGPRHPLWTYLMDSGIDADDWLWFADNPCPPDMLGVNYYVTSERWLDDRADAYPEQYRGQIGERRFADIEAPRVSPFIAEGIGALLSEAWQRYHLPVAVTEVHLDAPREDQMRWLLEVWQAAAEARREGADIRAVTVWALLGSFDWNCLVTEARGYYEPGPYDVRGPEPRPTALARLMREIAAEVPPSHPVLQGAGRRRAPYTLIGDAPIPDDATAAGRRRALAGAANVGGASARPVLVLGRESTLGAAFLRLCQRRNIACHGLATRELDLTVPSAVADAIARHRPWAVVQAGDSPGIDAAEIGAGHPVERHTLGHAVLARACAEAGVDLLTFSSDQVFDGRKQAPYVETDDVCPINAYGRSKAAAERQVLQAHPASLVLRTGGFFGPWDRENFLTQAMARLTHGRAFTAANDVVATPVFLPDLVNAALDLLVDRETGLWHVTHAEPVTWAELVARACAIAGVGARGLRPRSCEQLDLAARRPPYTALASNRSTLLPALDDALSRYVRWNEGVLRSGLPRISAA